MKFFTRLLALHGVIFPTGYRTRPSRHRRAPPLTPHDTPSEIVYGEENGSWSLEKYWKAQSDAEQQGKTIPGPIDDVCNWAEKKGHEEDKSASRVLNEWGIVLLEELVKSTEESAAVSEIFAASKTRATDAAAAAEKISQFLMHPSQRVKVTAAKELGELGASSNPYVPILVSLASGLADKANEHPDEHVSWIALKALGKIGGDAWEYKRDFLQVLANGSPVPEENYIMKSDAIWARFKAKKKRKESDGDQWHKRRFNEGIARISLLSLAAGKGSEEASDFITVFHRVLKTHSSHEGQFVAPKLAEWGDGGQEFVEDLVNLVVDGEGVTVSRASAANALGKLKGSACQHVGKLQATLLNVQEQIGQARQDVKSPRHNYEEAVQREKDARVAAQQAESRRVEALGTWQDAFMELNKITLTKSKKDVAASKKSQGPIQESELQEMEERMNTTQAERDAANNQADLAREEREEAEWRFRDAENKVKELENLHDRLRFAIEALKDELSRPEK